VKDYGNEEAGLAVYYLTLMASNGHKKTSAMNSAEAEAIDQTIFLLLA
jgi:hypothetical protein